MENLIRYENNTNDVNNVKDDKYNDFDIEFTNITNNKYSMEMLSSFNTKNCKNSFLKKN